MAYTPQWNDVEAQFRAVAEDIKTRFPQAWATSGHSTEYVERVVDACRKTLPNGAAIYFCNGKRGDRNNISRDIVAMPNPSGARSPDGDGVELHDFIVAHDSPQAHIGWGDVTQDTINGAAQQGIATPAVLVVPRQFGDGPPPPPQPTSGWEVKHNEMLLLVYQLGGDPGAALVRRVAEQFAFSFPGEGWGHKASSPNNPPSSDVVARQSGGRLVGYRVVPRTVNPAAIDLTGQHFIPVSPIDHVGAGAPPQPPTNPPTEPPTTPPPAGELKALLEAVTALRSELTQLNTKVDVAIQNYFALREAIEEIKVLASKPVVVDWPTYVGELRILGQRVPVTLRPQP